MKKFLLPVVVCFLLSVSLSAQVTYKVDVQYNSNNSEISADIIITVSDGKPDFIYSLNTNDPINGTALKKSEKTNRYEYTFTDVKPGTYFLKIEESNGMWSGQSVKVEESVVTQ